jgi:hypothetical protein
LGFDLAAWKWDGRCLGGFVAPLTDFMWPNSLWFATQWKITKVSVSGAIQAGSSRIAIVQASMKMDRIHQSRSFY